MSIMQIIVTGVALTLAGLGFTVWRRGKLADRLKTELDAAKAEKSRLAEEVRNAQITPKILTALCLTTILMSGCSQKATTVTNTGCMAFGKIYVSRQDTAETKRQVLNHNTVYEQVCEQDKK
ncbi:hypothetical protein IFE17_09260 [Actinobacillus sp. GY-402]|nr:hypothetical protein IFE17_09260 [Actinobacillus sp. GY-402]